MGGSHATSSMEPRHYNVQNNKLHAISANVRSRGSSPRGSKTLKLKNHISNPTVPKWSRRKRLAEIRQAKSCGKHTKISGRDKGMERPEGQIEGFRCGQFGIFAKPSHWKHCQVSDHVYWTIRHKTEDMARRILFIRPSRVSSGALLECRKPPPFFHLNQNCKQRSRELQTSLRKSSSFLIPRAHTLFLIGEARKSVRFLMRRHLYTPKQ
jgi:hypothetical protein